MKNVAEAMVFLGLVTAPWAVAVVSDLAERPGGYRVSRWWLPLFLLRAR